MDTLIQDLNPWPFFALQLILSIYILGFTSPSSSLRLAIFPLLVTCGYITCSNLRYFIPRAPWISLISCFSPLFILHYLEMALLSLWNFEDQGPLSTANPLSSKPKLKQRDISPKKTDTLWNRMSFGVTSLISFRDLNTSHEIKNSPHFDEYNTSYTPSRTTYLLTNLPQVLICYLIIDIIESQPPPPDASILFASSKIPVLANLFAGELNGEDVALRIGSSLGFWIVLYCLLNGMAFAIGCLCVILGISEVREWRPLMGSPGDAYTLRGFWGKFWHQGTRKSFSYPSIYFVDNILHFSRGIISRYLKVFLTFYVSEILHVIASWSGGMAWSASGSVRFFIAQAVGIVIEDFVQWVWRSFFGDSGRGEGGGKDGKGIKTWMKVVGFVWVTVFMLFWSTPAWAFPITVSNIGVKEGKMLPFSVIGFVIDRLT